MHIAYFEVKRAGMELAEFQKRRDRQTRAPRTESPLASSRCWSEEISTKKYRRPEQH